MEALKKEDLVLICPFQVTSADTDREARLRPGALVNFLIQSAIRSADALGFGFKGLQKENLFWVLSRMTIEISRPLMWYEHIHVETWPKNVEGILYLRDFVVKDKQEAPVARATSAWLAVDKESKRPKIFNGLEAQKLTILRDLHALGYSPLKLAPVEAQHDAEVTVTYFDIDLNRHVTSSRYVDWMVDRIPEKFLANHYPSRLSVNYLKETGLGENVLIRHSEEPPAQFRFEGLQKSKNVVAFRGELEF